MQSAINAANPTHGAATTASVRANFAAAKSEIEDLGTAKLLRIAYSSETVESFQRCGTNDVGQVVEFNQTAIDTASGIFTFDAPNHAVTILQPCVYAWKMAVQIVRKIGTSDLDWSIWIQTKVPGGDWTNYPGSRKILTLPADMANAKVPVAFGNDNRVTVAGTQVRFLQACTNVSKDVGIITYAATGNYPGAAGAILNLHRVGGAL
jgi:hypothetical protein